MPHRRRNTFGRTLAGLLVLLSILLPATRAGAVMLTVSDTTAHAALAGQADEHPASFPAHSHSGTPCDGCEHPDNPACCLSCGFPVAELPLTLPAPRPQAAASLRFLMPSISSPDGLTSAPDLPPPRHIV